MDVSESENVELRESHDGLNEKSDKGGKEIIEVVDDDVTIDEEGEIAVPKIGMEFDTVEEIYECYGRYAKRMGFLCKKRSSKKDNGQLRHVTFTCIREGKKKRVTDASVVLNPPFKTGCKAKLTARLEPDNKWRISVLVLEHNHQNIPIAARYWRYNKVINNPVKRKHLRNDKEGTRVHELYHTIAVEDIPEIVSEQSPQGMFSLNRCDIGEAQFYKFDNDKSHEKFHSGQILNCTRNGLNHVLHQGK
ncbi:protein FAR1-RELATED SEQUENCE 4-like isoform X2 [Papaver somniferum]|uniref:protein FAR1-RELATED SEQUENCE 4-like isoform X2 n=1 Tax=Papaver somniferum TaxID=3469 RepID=UPI000E6F598E|nr:protein FAR1-RELATED SEQUENCE 4-like isoform X2 [Papaver somniferum]XP_026427928.1 protein FAR1-RELATED SEQUENCE 4-like isoform X2 [Papaver somniferum]